MQNIQRQSVIKSNFTGNDIELEFKHLYQFINSIQGSKSITFKGGKIDTVEALHSEGVPNFKGLKLGKVKKNDFDLTVQDTFTFANEGYIKGYDGRGFFIGFDDFDNYTSTLFEMDNCVIRGSLFARQFVIDTYKYRAGNEIQGAGGGIVRNTDRSTWFELEDMTGNTGVFCEVNDVVMCQEVDRKGVTYDVNGDVVDDSYLIKRLTYKVSSISGNKCYLTSVTGAPGNKGTISKGDEFAVLYNETDSTRQNIIGYMNNVKYAPYIFMKSGISNWPGWSATNNVDLVLGRLDWFTDADFGTLSGFGLFCDNVYLKGHISLANNGYINLGKTAYNDTTNGGFWIGDSDATATVNPYFYLGTASDTKYMIIDTVSGVFNTLGFEISAGAIKSTPTMTYARGIAGTEFGYWLGKYGTSDYRFFLGSSTLKYFSYDNTNLVLQGGSVSAGELKSSPTMTYARGVGHTEDGYWLGELGIYDWRFFIGNPFAYMKYDNTNLTIYGGYINTSILRSTDTMTYARGIAGTEAGFWLGKYAAYDYRFFIGSSASKCFKYDNTDLSLIGGTITGGTIQTAETGQRVIISSGGSYANSIQFIYNSVASTIYSSADGTIGVSASNFVINVGATGNGIQIIGGIGNVDNRFDSSGISINYNSTASPQFIVDDLGRLTRVNNLAASGYTGYVLRSDGTSYTPALLAASDIADGTVSNTEFQYINSLTSNAQSQINGKQAVLTYQDINIAGSTPSGGSSKDVTRDTSTGYIWMNIAGSWYRIV